METQTNALIRTTASTWGATLASARLIYNAVVRPAMAHGAAAWHACPGESETGSPRRRHANGPVKRLIKVQNKCLRVVAGAYKATPTAVLETETHTPPLDLYLNTRLASFRRRHKESGMEEVVRKACEKVRRRLRHGNASRGPTTGERQTQWAEGWRGQAPESGKRAEQQAMERDWKERWAANPPTWGLVGVGPPSRSVLKLHQGLRKAESSLITQIRSGRIGLAAFLNKANVPGYESPTCQCGQARETATHVIIHCPRFAEIRHILEDPVTGQLDIRALTGTSAGTQRLARWFMKLRILPQFQLAEQLLYERTEVFMLRDFSHHVN